MLNQSFAQCMCPAEASADQGGGGGSYKPIWKNEDEKQILDLATEFASSSARHADLYFRLCLTIREKQCQPDRVEALLVHAALAKPVISQIKAVSFVSSSLWNDYKSRFSGFKATYTKAVAEKRGEKGPAWYVSRFHCEFANLVKRVPRVPAAFHHEGLNHLFTFAVDDIKGEVTTFTSPDWVLKVSRRANEQTKNNSKKPNKTKAKA